MDEYIDRWIDGYIDAWMDGWIYRQMGGLIYRCMDAWIYRWMDASRHNHITFSLVETILKHPYSQQSDGET